MIRSKIGLAIGLSLTLMVASATYVDAAVGGPVSAAPPTWTPQLATEGTDGTIEQVRQLVPCGANMYAVGTFTEIKRYSTRLTRNNAFSFSATTGVVTSWNPNVNGTVNSVALSADCSTAYLGGVFTAVGGTAVKNIVAVSTSTGAVNAGFKSSAGGQVSALLISGSHLLAGGYFPSINGSARKYFASLNPTTGLDDGYVDLNIFGNYQFSNAEGIPVNPNPTRVYNFALSPDKTKLLATGVFTSVGGNGRRQIFMLDLGATRATVNPWYSTEFDANCSVNAPFYLQDASWAPDMSKIYIATTGGRPAIGPGHLKTDMRAGLCDAAAAYPTTAGPVKRLWINYTGCDSLYSTAADANTVYIGGHERWASHPGPCGTDGAGAVDAPGMVGLSPANGSVVFNPTRGRGLGAVDMVVTGAGLWIASDNHENTSMCAGVFGHAGICFLPY